MGPVEDHPKLLASGPSVRRLNRPDTQQRSLYTHPSYLVTRRIWHRISQIFDTNFRWNAQDHLRTNLTGSPQEESHRVTSGGFTVLTRDESNKVTSRRITQGHLRANHTMPPQHDSDNVTSPWFTQGHLTIIHTGSPQYDSHRVTSVRFTQDHLSTIHTESPEDESLIQNSFILFLPAPVAITSNKLVTPHGTQHSRPKEWTLESYLFSTRGTLISASTRPHCGNDTGKQYGASRAATVPAE